MVLPVHALTLVLFLFSVIFFETVGQRKHVTLREKKARKHWIVSVSNMEENGTGTLDFYIENLLYNADARS